MKTYSECTQFNIMIGLIAILIVDLMLALLNTPYDYYIIPIMVFAPICIWFQYTDHNELISKGIQ